MAKREQKRGSGTGAKGRTKGFDAGAWAREAGGDEPSASERARAAGAIRERRAGEASKRRARALELELEAERAARELAVRWREDKPQVHRIEPLKLRGRSGRKGLPHLVTCSMLSDCHVEERVDEATVNGLNSYSLAIAEDRLDRYWHSVVKMVRKEQAHGDIRTHVQWIGGDLFSGHIHDDTIESTATAPLETVFWLRPRIMSGLRFLCDELDVEELVVVWQYGNHGRDTKKPRIATAAEHNYEWMLGQFMREDVMAQPWAKKKRLRFIAERGTHTYLDMSGFVVRFHHGDKVQYQGGVGGLSIPLNKAIASWNEARHADLDVIGHWHQLEDFKRAVVNGSLIGWNAFALSIKAKFEKPAQGFFEIDLARREKTGFFKLHVTPHPEAADHLRAETWRAAA